MRTGREGSWILWLLDGCVSFVCVEYFTCLVFLHSGLDCLPQIFEEPALCPRRNQRHHEHREARRQVIVQALLYSLVFINTITWSSMETIYYLIGKEYDDFGDQYWISILALTFFPLQGFFNFLIFIRPRYLKNRNHLNNHGRLRAFWEAVWYPNGTRLGGGSQSTLQVYSSDRRSHSTLPGMTGPKERPTNSNNHDDDDDNDASIITTDEARN